MSRISGYCWVYLLLASLFNCSIYLYYYTSVLSYKKKVIKADVPYLKELPPVSVIICARNESENLAAFLPSVLKQKYPDFQVIVVNDGSSG